MQMWSTAEKRRGVALAMPVARDTYSTFSNVAKPPPTAMPHKTKDAGEGASFRNQPQHTKFEFSELRGQRRRQHDLVASSTVVQRRQRQRNFAVSSMMPGVKIHSTHARRTQLTGAGPNGHSSPTGSVALQFGSDTFHTVSKITLRVPATVVANKAPVQNMVSTKPGLIGSFVMRSSSFQEGTSTAMDVAEMMRYMTQASAPPRMICSARPRKKKDIVKQVQLSRPSRL
mmetsp:Transcript_113110/g.320104  ORF Transcript_113110/g.320104 Transcript_113110/m.320104 type:complete len:229 (-) Transcript_113110:448-1134(-)